ncbi:MAG: restriction endonuclease, SacI family [Alphaproteobacteria bacterium]
MASLDYVRAKNLLTELFAEAEDAFVKKQTPSVDEKVEKAAEVLFRSSTQSYREVLLGCGLVRLLAPSINIRLPYMNQGDEAFNGRTLDERVINPFLHDRRIPSSKGPYLAVFRRSVELQPEIISGLKDKSGYEAMMLFLDALEVAKNDDARALVLHLLHCFLVMREAATISLAKISRLSLEQYGALMDSLLQVSSGGLVPVLLVVAMLRTINACYSLNWEVEFQGINVADKASGAGGDVTVRGDKRLLLAIEVTERPIDKARVVSTFNTKIVEAGIEDYLFVYAHAEPGEDARQAARTYFSQGHEINFVQVQEWILNNLGTLGSKCRAIFTQEILKLLDTPQVPAKVKVAWNDILRNVVSL